MTHSLSPLLTAIRSNTAQTPVLLTSTHPGRGGAEDIFWMAVISILRSSLWDIPRWFCTVFRFFLLLHDQRPKLLIRTSKGSLLFCWRAHWQDSSGAMIITAPIWCPWNWHQQPVAPSGQEERRDSWTVKRGEWRGRGEKMEDTLAKRRVNRENRQKMGLLCAVHVLVSLCQLRFG